MTSKKSSYDKHLLTLKHVNRTELNTLEQEIKEIKKYKCKNCNKSYSVRNSLWYHENKCKETEPQIKKEANLNDGSLNGASITDESISGASISDASSNIIQLLIKETSDFKNIIFEMVKSNNELNTNSIINTNSHNNTTNNKIFNLQLFLNEECKDAMNMSEFINSIELKISDLENIGKVGYVEGMSSIIIRELNDTDMYKRPVHCSDAKRETMYVKEENIWEKDNSEAKQMIKAVRGIDKKNYKMLTKWKEMDPKCVDSKSNQCDKYMKIMSKVMDGDIENVNKVIKKIAKEVVIEKPNKL
jgi:transposase-like protein